MLRATLAALALAGCAAAPTPQAVKDRVQQERQEDRVRALQDDFNRTAPGA